MSFEPALPLALNIAAAMGRDWSAYLARESIDHLATLERSDGLRLSISHRDGRGHCSPQEKSPFGDRSTPDLHGFGIIRSSDPRPNATFNPNKRIRLIVSDITRKVLVPFEPMRIEYIAKRDAKNEIRAKCHETATDIATAIGSHVTGVGGQVDPDRLLLGLGAAHDAYGRFEISTYMGGRVKVEMNNLTLDDAQDLALWMRSRNKPLGHAGG